MMKSIRILSFLFVFAGYANAQPKLPAIFGDSMVLQRDVPLRIWGTASPGERITVGLHQQKKVTKADKKGNWLVILNPEKAGGPYELSVTGKSTITLRGLLMGDVWFCSGQSNMEMPLKGWGTIYDADEEISKAAHPQIRLYTVPMKVAAMPVNEPNEAVWQVCSPASIPPFSAVGYFFGRRLQQDLKVPIGLINSTWGGTMIESWISHAGLAKDSNFQAAMQKAPAMTMEQLLAIRKKKEAVYLQQLKKELQDMKDSASWKTLAYDDSRWQTMPLPDQWEHQPNLVQLDGVVWFRKTITIMEEAGSPAIFHLGKIDDNDKAFLNGSPLGATNGWNIDRRYIIGPGVLRAGKNVIAVRVEDTGGGGGIWGDSSELFVEVNGRRYPLAGNWQYHIQEVKHNSNGIGPNDYPSLLYNAMVHPYGRLNIKGCIWYQGEANAWTAYQYRYALPLLIRDWRKLFGNAQLPFYFAQLTSFMADKGNSNKGSTWAEIRESQASALQVPNTGMAVITDIGDVNDIHPRNKKDVGERLAALALKNTYHQQVMTSGPVFKTFVREGNNIRIIFSSVGTGLAVRQGTALAGFEIAGEDRKFYPAVATITGNEVIVHADQVGQPVSVRYAWADDVSAANLCNAAGWPAAPFRTDNWPGITIHNKYEPSLK
jgi:sialate O-acetylesterase